ncbi:Dyp-type peroxidase [Leeia sp. TBRC 13508]|uniref:Dyp-type peroxidase n=1 Tax=Leeia speluncae TaxID=2884804 RepID=A0ABS8D6G0_9NEIS|nr:Dyp-type peroxidase [Leeia speluncae]MCB6183732.1 Dyp-type peroxidase [Leeia speluncae]
MSKFQGAILAPIPAFARHLLWKIQDLAKVEFALDAIKEFIDGEKIAIGYGKKLVDLLGIENNQLKAFHPPVGAQRDIPSNEYDLWLWIRSAEIGELVHLQQLLESKLAGLFVLEDVVQCFKYKEGRDLTGYEDGTENPVDKDALNVAVGDMNDAYAVLQIWQHNLNRFHSFTPEEKDLLIGRRLKDNEEIEDAPDSAHVKRTAQESFEPEAFMVRRSMPWSDGCSSGLAFLSFEKNGMNAFESQFKRMLGLEDGVEDGLFRFSVPIKTSYFWIPEV